MRKPHRRRTPLVPKCLSGACRFFMPIRCARRQLCFDLSIKPFFRCFALRASQRHKRAIRVTLAAHPLPSLLLFLFSLSLMPTTLSSPPLPQSLAKPAFCLHVSLWSPQDLGRRPGLLRVRGLDGSRRYSARLFLKHVSIVSPLLLHPIAPPPCSHPFYPVVLGAPVPPRCVFESRKDS